MVSFNGLLGRLSLARVTCVGDVMLDQFLEGEVHRLSPEAPIPVIQVRSEKAMPGGAGNVVRNIAALGAKARLISVIGDDHQGRRLKELFASQHNLSVQLVVEERRPTTVKTRYIAARQQLLRADREVTVVEGVGWKIQFDDELPRNLSPGKTYYIPKNTYHRVMKGQTNLVVEIRENAEEAK